MTMRRRKTHIFYTRIIPKCLKLLTYCCIAQKTKKDPSIIVSGYKQQFIFRVFYRILCSQQGPTTYALPFAVLTTAIFYTAIVSDKWLIPILHYKLVENNWIRLTHKYIYSKTYVLLNIQQFYNILLN